MHVIRHHFPTRFRNLLFAFLLLLLHTNGSAQFLETFSSNPFVAPGTATSSYAATTGSCQDPTYGLGPNMNSNCWAFPNRTGTGDFMTIDNDMNSSGIIWQDNVPLTPGCYRLSVDGLNRRNTAGTSGGPADLDVLADGVPVGSVTIPLGNSVWTTQSVDFTLTAPASTIALDQTNSGLNMDYSVDNISIVSTCEITGARFAYCMDSCEYCFTPIVQTTPCVTQLDYHWDFGDGHIAHGPAPCHSYSADGQYTVCLTLYAYNSLNPGIPCDTAVICRTICVAGCTPGLRIGMENTSPKPVTARPAPPALVSAATTLQLSPVPARDALRVAHRFAAGTKLQVQVLGMDGRTVVSRRVTAAADSFVLDLSELATGAYCLVLRGPDGQRSSQKFVKE